MLGTFRKGDAALDALERIRAWTRARFRLDVHAPVFVAEVACSLPGCPPLETVVGFWTGEAVRHHFKVFKPAAAVVEDDLPPAWLVDALVVDENAGCDC